LIWNYYTFNNPIAFLAGSHVTSGSEAAHKEIGWHILTKILPWLFAIPAGNWSILSLNGFLAVLAKRKLFA